MNHIISFFILLSSLPLIGYFMQGNIGKGILSVILFFAFLALGALLLNTLAMYFVMAIPILLLAYSILFRRKNRK